MTEPDIKLEGDDLGPAVLPDFPDAPSIDELVQAPDDTERAPKEKAPEPEIPPATFSPEVLTKTVAQLDRTLSTLLRLEPENPEYIEGMAAGLLPLANYYAAQKPTVATLWLSAGLTTLAYTILKWQKASAVYAAKKAEAEEARAETG